MTDADGATRVLVVAHKTAATQPLVDAVRERAARGPTSFTRDSIECRLVDPLEMPCRPPEP